MGEVLLIVSVFLQAWSVVQAVRLAVLQRRWGWILLALANILMLGQRGYRLAGVVLEKKGVGPVAECLALLISLLMALGLTLLLAWVRTAGSEDLSPVEIQNGARKRLMRQAIILALLSLFGCAGLSFFAYTASRDAVTGRVLKGSLDLANMLGTAVNSAPDTPSALGTMSGLWKKAGSQYPDNYLCVIGADGRLLLNTRRPDKVGTFVGGTEILAGETGPRTVQELVASRGEWVGRNRNSEGMEQIAAYAYSPHLDALVAVHLPARSVDAEIRAAALPWGAGLALIFVLILPLSFGLLYVVGAASEKSAFQALARQMETEQRYALLIGNVKDHAIFLLDSEGRVTTWNSGAELLRGWTAEEVKGRHFSTFYTPEDVARKQADLDLEAAARQGSATAEGWRLRKDGSRFWASVTVSSAQKDAGQSGYLVVIRDITARKQSDDAVRESAEMLRAILRSLTTHLAVLDRAGNVLVVNPAWEHFAEKNGNPPAHRVGIGANYLEVCRGAGGADAPEAASALEGIQDVLSGNLDEFSIEYRCDSPEVKRWFVMTVSALRRAGGGAVVSHMDITERKQTEIRIRQLNRVYAVLSGINEAIVRDGDPRKLFHDACRIAVETGGFRMAWIGMTDAATGRIHIAAHAGASEQTLEKLDAIVNGAQPGATCVFTKRALATGVHEVCDEIETDPEAACWRDAALRRDYHSMASLPLKSGARVIGTFNLYAGEPHFFDQKEMRLLDELAIDISFAIEVSRREEKRQRAEDALRASEERFRQFAETIEEVFWMIDPARNSVLYVSPAYEKIWGRTCASVHESTTAWVDAIHPDDRARVAAAAGAGIPVGDYDEIFRIVRPDGTVRWIHDRAFPVRDADGKIHRVLGTARDITDRRQLEEQFRQSQKMDAIGQLAGGVAHDFNNLLAAIMIQADLAAATNPPAETRELLEDIQGAAERAAELTRQLLTFSRRQVMQQRALDLNESVSDLTRMLQRILREDVSLGLNLHPGPLLTRADAGMLDQVLINLVVNARDAMPGGGRLSIQTGERTLTAEEAASIPDAEPGRWVWLRVTDTGTGIEPEKLTRIFEPFFTTKAPGKGTGLGLATVFGIVKQHGGAIQVESEVTRGTTFQVFLRAVEKGDMAPGRTVARSELKRGTETILVVEDEPSVRLLTRIILERQGYRVLEAAHGVEALKIWEENMDAIHLLFTDIVMPHGINGRELAVRLQARKPALWVILTSGYSADIAGREITLQERQSFIPKPSSPERILETVRRCLDS